MFEILCHDCMSQNWHKERPVLFKYKVVDVKGDGDCFFRALHGAAFYQGILAYVAKCFTYGNRKDCWDDWNENLRNTSHNDREVLFVACVRRYLAERIRTGKENALLRRTWDLLRVMDEEDAKDIMADWLIDAYQNSRVFYNETDSSYPSFVNRVADGVRQQGNWVSELEVTIVKKVLEAKDIILLIASNNDVPDALPLNPHILVLVNMNNTHYKYMWYTDPSSMMGGGRTMRKKETGRGKWVIAEGQTSDGRALWRNSKTNELRVKRMVLNKTTGTRHAKYVRTRNFGIKG